MKKKICMLVLSLCMVSMFTACGDNSADTNTESNTTTEEEATDTEDTAEESEEVTADTRIVSVAKDDMSKYITLGQYEGLDVEKNIDEVTDESIETQINSNLSENMVESEDENATVKEGDTANINYEGKIDGVAFDGGTAEDYDLVIGSGSFIDGFEDGIIGMKKGETKDLNLTFPENYTEDLAGKDVVFTVTVNAIKQAPELTEEWVQGNTEFDTIDAYRENVRQELEATNSSAADSTALNSAWEQVLENSEVIEYPQEDIDEAVEEYQASLTSYAEQSGVSEEEFLEAQGMTQESFDEQAQQYAEYKVKQNLIVQAIMDEQGFTLLDDECKAAEDELVANYGVSSIDELAAQYGQTAINEVVALSRVGEFIIEKANVTESIVTEDDKEGLDADTAESESNAEDAAETEETSDGE